MSNIDKMIANEQLFTELTPEEDAAVSGGTQTCSGGGGFVNYGQIGTISFGSTPSLPGPLPDSELETGGILDT